MAVYAIAQISITNRDLYRRYQARFMDVFRKFQGRLLAADEQPRIVEGQWDCQKVVLLSFPDEGAFHDFWQSSEYQEIAKDRRQGTNGVVLLVKGLPS